MDTKTWLCRLTLQHLCARRGRPATRSTQIDRSRGGNFALTPSHIAGLAALGAAGLDALNSTIFYVFTHGSGSQDRLDTFAGLEPVTIGRASTAVGVAFLLTAWGLRQQVRSDHGPALGVLMAKLGAAGWLAGRILQCWLANPDNPADFNGVRVTLGFYVQAAGTVTLAGGLLVVAITSTATQASRGLRLGCLLAGCGIWLPALGPELIPAHVSRSLGWDVAATLMGLPGWLGLVLVGAALLRVPAPSPIAVSDPIRSDETSAAASGPPASPQSLASFVSSDRRGSPSVQKSHPNTYRTRSKS